MSGTEPTNPVRGNQAIEAAVILWVLGLELMAGRTPKDRSREPGFPADIESPPRLIEVKAAGGSARGADLPLEPAQIHEARTNPDFCLYVVDNIAQGDPAAFRLKVFAGKQLERLLDRAREKRYYELPVPVAEFDLAPGSDSL